MPELVRFSSYIKTTNKYVYFSFLTEKKKLFASLLFDAVESLNPWERIKLDFQLQDNPKFYRLPIIHALPKLGKKT